MPVWADTGHPAGPLNYRQIEELIAFLRAPNDQTYIKRDEAAARSAGRSGDRRGRDVPRLGDPNYAPEPGATPYPACWKDEFASASAGAVRGRLR